MAKRVVSKKDGIFKRVLNAILNKEENIKLRYEDGSVYATNDMETPYMLSFRGDQFSTSSMDSMSEDSSKSSPMKTSEKSVDVRVAVKPIDVLKELERVPLNFDLNDIDGKISILKDKEALINQSYAKREVKALIVALEARKKYAEFKSYFTQFDATTEEKINLLLSKYKLVMKEADIFIPEFPNIAIKIMKEFTEKVQLITGGKPKLYVIAPPEAFKQAFGKRDPILLAQSPFGFYYYILGAWDAEMILLSEL